MSIVHTLILVLSAIKKPYGMMLEKAIETWDSVKHPDTTTLYYIGHRPEPSTNQIFVSAFDESLYNIGRRTIEAYEHALTIPGWTHLARVHSSCYVHKRKLADYVNALLDTDVMYGLQADTIHGESFLAGCGHYLFSRDVIAKLVDHKHAWDHSIMEDNAVSKLSKSIGIPWGKLRTCSIDPYPGGGWQCIAYHGLPGISFTDFSDLNKLDQFFYRVKYDSDRSVDLKLMDLLFKHLV